LQFKRDFFKKYFLPFILLTLGFGIAFAQIKETSTIKADELETNPKDNSISALGNVELVKGQKVFNAEKVTYHPKEKIIEAEGNVKVNDALGNHFFAEKAKLTDDATQGDFYDAGIIFENGSSIDSSHIIRESKDIFLLNKPRYFLCPTDLTFNSSYEEILKQTLKKKRPLFSIKSSTLKVDQKENELTFKHAIIKVWGVPIFYLPYLKTAHPFKEKQTGFEAPEVKYNTYYRYGLFLPYYIRISDSKNLRLKPGYYQKNNKLMEASYNQKLIRDGYLRFNGAIIDDMGASKKIENTRQVTELEEGEYQDTRGYGEIVASYRINDLWSTYGFGKMVSDDYILRDYYQNYDEYIQSHIDVDRINENDYNLLKLQTLFFQEIREEIIPVREQTPQYVPIVDSHLEKNGITKRNLKLTYNLDSNYTSIHRSSGLQYNRLTLIPSVENKIIKNGNIFKTKLSLRGDGYFLDENYKTPDSNTYDKGEFRSMFGAEVEWRLPLITKIKSSKLIVEPIVKYMFDSDQGNFEDSIPNEDSQSAEISYENMFSHNRYGGYDRTEYGNRISYGINNEFYHEKYGTFNLFLAQGYRDENDDTTYQIRGFEEDFSDIVGKMVYKTKSIFDVYYRFRLDRTTFTGKSNEITTDFKFPHFRVYSTYAMLKAERARAERQEQMTYGGNVYLFNKWTLGASATTDFVNKNKTIQKTADISYNGKCTLFTFNFVENSPRDLTKFERSFKVNFVIKTGLF